jgi:hypothetical protein
VAATVACDSFPATRPSCAFSCIHTAAVYPDGVRPAAAMSGLTCPEEVCAREPKPPTFVAHGMVVHGPDSGSNFARCVLRIRPSYWRPRMPRKALLSHVSSTAGTAKLRAVALDRRRPALALAVDPPKQARLPCSVLWVDCSGHGLLTNLRCWPRRAQPRPCFGPQGAGGHRPAAATQGDAGQHRALLCEYPRGLRCFSGQ